MPEKKTTIEEYVRYFNKEDVINVTITYTSRFSDADTIYFAPSKLKKYLESTDNIDTIVGYYFCNEKHKNSRRFHMHGQIEFKHSSSRDVQIERFNDMYHYLSKTFGKTTIKWNNPEFEEDSDYPSYTHYCFKEADEPVIRYNFRTPFEVSVSPIDIFDKENSILVEEREIAKRRKERNALIRLLRKEQL